MNQNPPNPEALASELAHDLPSPFCPGRSISSCPSQASRELEAEILQQARAGKSRETIEQNLIARFGEEKLGTEVRADVMIGVTLIAVIAIGGLLILGRRWAAAQGKEASLPGSAAQTQIEQAELDRLDDELARVREL